ncbi:hypothetical protein SUGI_0664290 [Cryptomeria japonica]|nr:hypothetical protein SUGI_0664290 [Cryptomeria japonica]
MAQLGCCLLYTHSILSVHIVFYQIYITKVGTISTIEFSVYIFSAQLLHVHKPLQATQQPPPTANIKEQLDTQSLKLTQITSFLYEDHQLYNHHNHCTNQYKNTNLSENFQNSTNAYSDYLIHGASNLQLYAILKFSRQGILQTLHFLALCNVLLQLLKQTISSIIKTFSSIARS